MNHLLLALSLGAGALHVDGAFFRDAQGAVRLLRGVNATGDAKVPPFMPLRNSAQLDALPAWGMNVLRLVFIWEAYEPTQGRYNSVYLDYITRVCNWAHERGLYVIIDFHQDGFARTLLGGCGEGFPFWAVGENIPKSTPDNGSACSLWPARTLFDRDLENAWHAFYANENLVRDHFLEMTRRVAAHLRHAPAVIGYDLLNEPMGNESTELLPLYEDEAKAIREQDPQAILFVSPRAAVSMGLQTHLPMPRFSNMAYAPHYYDTLVVGFKIWVGQLFLSPFDTMLGTAYAWDVPLFLGEFGAPATAWGASSYMDTLFRRMDEHFVSGAQWTYSAAWSPTRKDGWNGEDFSIVDERGLLRDNFRARPYPQRIAGTPRRMLINRQGDRCFIEVEWDHVPAQGATLVFAPENAFCTHKRPTLETQGDDMLCGYDGTWVRCTSSKRGMKHVRLTG